MDSLKLQFDAISKQLYDSQLENLDLQEKAHESESVIIFNDDSRVYKSELQECVYTLLSHNVTTSHVSPVIETVLKLVNKKANKLPSTSTVNNMNIQRLMLAQKQLGEEYAVKKNTTILSDETTKFGLKFEGFHAADNTGRMWVLGVRQMTTKSSQNTLNVFNQILCDIDEVSAHQKTIHLKQYFSILYLQCLIELQHN